MPTSAQHWTRIDGQVLCLPLLDLVCVSEHQATSTDKLIKCRSDTDIRAKAAQQTSGMHVCNALVSLRVL